MSTINPPRVNPEVAELLDWERLDELGPGTADRQRRAELAELSVARLVAPAAVVGSEMARSCLAGLWLHHGFLDESHEISQSLATVEGSYWHALMHRREPDYDNSKYWFRRVGDHEIFAALAAAAEGLAQEAACDFAAPLRRKGADWDPFAFVDLCRQAPSAGTAQRQFCQRVQLAEWQLLFAHCYAGAGGAAG